MTADLVDWRDEYVLDHRRRLKTAAFVSLAVHACVLGLFAVTPPRPVTDLPEAIAVDLIAAPARAPARSRPAATKPSPPPPPAPVAPAAPPPPIAKAPVQVLPEETPGRIREAKPEPKPPKPVVQAKPEPKPEPAPPPPPDEPAYEDDEAAMAALMEELGGDDVDQLLKDSAQARVDRDAALAAQAAETAGKATGKLELSPEQLAWDVAVKQKIARNFPVPTRTQGRGLVAQVEIRVSASGDILGEPKLVGTSGDRTFDSWALSAIGLASPLPPPPSPGVRRLNMRSEERQQ